MFTLGPALRYIAASPASLLRYYENDSNTSLSNGNKTADFFNAGSAFGIAHLSRYDGTNEQIAYHDGSYIEFAIAGSSTGTFVGLVDNSLFSGGFLTTANPVGTAGFYLITDISYSGVVAGLITNGTNTSNSSYDYAVGDVIAIAVDWSTGKVWFKKTSSGWISGDPELGTSPTFTLPHTNFSFVAGSYARSSFAYAIAISDTPAYTAPTGFTLLSATPPNNSSLSLLVRDGADISPTHKNVTFWGTAAISTSEFKFGTSSIQIPASGDFATIPHHADFEMGSGNFTIELYVRFTSFPGSAIIFNNAIGTGVFSYQIYISASNHIIAWGFDNTVSIAFTHTSSTTAVIDTWYHCALVRLGNVISFYLDGALVGSTTVTLPLYTNAGTQLQIGGYDTGAFCMRGYIDEIRVLKGICAYTAPFTPRAAPYLITD